MGRRVSAIFRLVLAWLLAWTALAWGQALAPIPPLTGPVVDAAGWLDAGQRAGL